MAFIIHSLKYHFLSGVAYKEDESVSDWVGSCPYSFLVSSPPLTSGAKVSPAIDSGGAKGTIPVGG